MAYMTSSFVLDAIKDCNFIVTLYIYIEREGQRGRETDRQRDRQKDRDTDTHTDREKQKSDKEFYLSTLWPKTWYIGVGARLYEV